MEKSKTNFLDKDILMHGAHILLIMKNGYKPYTLENYFLLA